MKKLLAAALAAHFALIPVAALAQSVQQSGAMTPNTAAMWSATGIIKGGNTATDSPLTTFGVTRDGVDAICVSSDRQTAVGRNTLCFQAATAGPAKISLQNFGTATAQNLQFVINGTPVTIPTGGSSFVQLSGAVVSGHMPCWSGTTGLVVDCGVGAVAGTLNGLAYYTAAGAIGSTVAGANGQVPVGQTGSGPLFRTLAGDVGSLTNAGVLTLQSVNGIPFPSSFTANGVLLANGSSAFTSITTSNVGNCLLSQGTSSPPIWASCASGSGSAGGANTQVQFNNSTALGGSANLTWVSPALTIGQAGSVTGQLALASAGGLSGTVTVQNPSTTSAYNFNLPISAGGIGQPLVSAGGASSPMVFQTLGIVGGGTNCSVASGTCLDNISGFSTTGFLQRTGAGTYTTSLVVPVSGGGTGLANGTSGGFPYYSAAGTIASTGTLTANGVLLGGGLGGSPTSTSVGTNGQLFVGVTSGAPGFVTASGDISAVTSGGAFTIANSAVSNAKLASAGAYTLKGNFTNGSAAPTDTQIGSLTQKASPAAGDYILLVDNSASSQMKYATVSSIASAGSVSSIDGATGAFTTNNGLTTSANVIQLTAARRTLPTTQKLTSGSGATYTTATNALWLEVQACGGGGGGSGANNGTTAVAGSTGGTTTFNSITALGGSPGSASASAASASVGGAGGTGGTGTVDKRIPGNPGGGGNNSASTSNPSGQGGGSPLWGGGGVGIQTVGAGSTAGNAGAANTGGGGGGAMNAQGSNNVDGGGGGSGECFYLIINSPAATYTYTIAAGGAGGVATASGGAGGTGFVLVTEHYGS